MRNADFSSRFLALSLALSLALPAGPVFALRGEQPVNAGMEDDLTRAFGRPVAGAEKMGNFEAAELGQQLGSRVNSILDDLPGRAPDPALKSVSATLVNESPELKLPLTATLLLAQMDQLEEAQPHLWDQQIRAKLEGIGIGITSGDWSVTVEHTGPSPSGAYSIRFRLIPVSNRAGAEEPEDGLPPTAELVGPNENEQGEVTFTDQSGVSRTFRVATELIKQNAIGLGTADLRLYEGSRPIGYIRYGLGRLSIEGIYIDPEYRNQGLSSVLLVTFFRAFKAGLIPEKMTGGIFSADSFHAYARQPLSALLFKRFGFEAVPLHGAASTLAFEVTVGRPSRPDQPVPLYSDEPEPDKPSPRNQMRRMIRTSKDWSGMEVVDRPIPGEKVLVYANYSVPEGNEEILRQRINDPQVKTPESWAKAGAEQEKWEVKLDPVIGRLDKQLQVLIRDQVVPLLLKGQGRLLKQLLSKQPVSDFGALVSLDASRTLTELLRWVNIHLLAPRGVVLTTPPDQRGQKSPFLLVPVVGYELLEVPGTRSLVLPVFFMSTKEAAYYAGWEHSGMAFVNVRTSSRFSRSGEDARRDRSLREETWHALDELESGTALYPLKGFEDLFARLKLRPDSRLRQDLPKLSLGSVEVAAKILLEIRADLRGLAGPDTEYTHGTLASVPGRILMEGYDEHWRGEEWIISELSKRGAVFPPEAFPRWLGRFIGLLPRQAELDRARRAARELWESEFSPEDPIAPTLRSLTGFVAVNPAAGVEEISYVVGAGVERFFQRDGNLEKFLQFRDREFLQVATPYLDESERHTQAEFMNKKLARYLASQRSPEGVIAAKELKGSGTLMILVLALDSGNNIVGYAVGEPDTAGGLPFAEISELAVTASFRWGGTGRFLFEKVLDGLTQFERVTSILVRDYSAQGFDQQGPVGKIAARLGFEKIIHRGYRLDLPSKDEYRWDAEARWRLRAYSQMDAVRMKRMLEERLNRPLEEDEEKKVSEFLRRMLEIRQNVNVVEKLNQTLSRGGFPDCCVQVTSQVMPVLEEMGIPGVFVSKRSFLDKQVSSTLYPSDRRIRDLWWDFGEGDTPFHLFVVMNFLGVSFVLDLSGDQFVRRLGEPGLFVDQGVVLIPAQDLKEKDWPYVGGNSFRVAREQLAGILREEQIRLILAAGAENPGSGLVPAERTAVTEREALRGEPVTLPAYNRSSSQIWLKTAGGKRFLAWVNGNPPALDRASEVWRTAVTVRLWGVEEISDAELQALKALFEFRVVRADREGIRTEWRTLDRIGKLPGASQDPEDNARHLAAEFTLVDWWKGNPDNGWFPPGQARIYIEVRKKESGERIQPVRFLDRYGEQLQSLSGERRRQIEDRLGDDRAVLTDVVLPDTLTLYAQGDALFVAIAQHLQDKVFQGIRFDTQMLPPTQEWQSFGLIFRDSAIPEEPVNPLGLPLYPPLRPEDVAGVDPNSVLSAVFRARLGIPESAGIDFEFFRDAEGRMHAVIFA